MKVETIYNTKFVICGDRIEVYKYSGYIRKGGESKNKEGRKGKKDISEDEKKINRIISRTRNLNNARNNIVRIVSCNPDLISFITITYKCNMQDLKKSKQQVNKFFKKLKADYEDLKYIYVLEFQDRGAIHYHILTNFPIPVKTGRQRKTEEQKQFEQEFSRKYWKYGFVDCRNLKSEDNTNIGRYISSYLTLEQYTQDLGGMRIFSTSRNINRPHVETLEMKCNIDDLCNVEGYKLNYSNVYETGYTDKMGKARKGQVNYFELILDNGNNLSEME